MLDNIFGNVFGRSKRQSSSSNNSNQNRENNENTDGFIVLGQTSGEQQSAVMSAAEDPPPLYPTTFLTNDMIRMGASVQSQSSSSTVESSTGFSYIKEQKYSSPIDNIPFNSAYNASNDLVNSNIDINKCFETINRIQQYLSTPSQSEYSFTLENAIISESLLFKTN